MDRSKVFHPRRRWKQKPFYGNCSATEQCPTSTSNLFFSLSLPLFFFRHHDRWMGLAAFLPIERRRRIMDEKFSRYLWERDDGNAMVSLHWRCDSLSRRRQRNGGFHTRENFYETTSRGFVILFFHLRDDWRKYESRKGRRRYLVLFFFFFGNKFGILKLEARRTKLISSLKYGRIFWRGNMARGLEDEVFFTLRSFGNNDYEITRVIWSSDLRGKW